MTDKIKDLCLKINNMEKKEDFVLINDEKNTATTLINTAISSRSVNRILNGELIEINKLINEDNPISEGNLLTIKEIICQLNLVDNHVTSETTE